MDSGVSSDIPNRKWCLHENIVKLFAISSINTKEWKNMMAHPGHTHLKSLQSSCPVDRNELQKWLFFFNFSWLEHTKFVFQNTLNLWCNCFKMPCILTLLLHLDSGVVMVWAQHSTTCRSLYLGWERLKNLNQKQQMLELLSTQTTFLDRKHKDNLSG